MSQGSTDNSPWYDDRRLAIGEGLSGQFLPKGRRIYCSLRCKHVAGDTRSWREVP